MKRKQMPKSRFPRAACIINYKLRSPLPSFSSYPPELYFQELFLSIEKARIFLQATKDDRELKEN